MSPTSAANDLDRLLSDPTRLTIMATLCELDWCTFAFAREATSLSDSALSKQLATLEADGQVERRRKYHGRVPQTTIRATEEGRDRFRRHVQALQAIINRRLPDTDRNV